MENQALHFVQRMIETEAREQLQNLPVSFRKYRSEIDFRRLTGDAIELIPRNFRALGDKYHDPRTRQLRVRIAVERSLSNILHELKLYYVSKVDLEGEEDIPTEPLEGLMLSR